MALLSMTIALLLMANYPCLSLFTAGNSTLPRDSTLAAVGYDSSTNTLLIFGGTYPSETQFVTFKDHTFTDMGEHYLPSPTGSSSQSSIQLGNELWMLQQSGAGFVKADTTTYNVTVPSITFPTTVGGRGCLAGIDGYVFVIGGNVGSPGSEAAEITQIFRIRDGQWLTNLPFLNTKRMTLSCIAHENKLFAIGGDDGNIFLESIETLDISNMETISTQTWDIHWADPLRSGRKASRAVVYGTDIYVIGGKDNNGNRVDDINVIDAISGTVSIHGDTLSYATSYASSIIVDNVLYVFAGVGTYDDVNTYQYSTLPALLPTKNPTAAPTLSPLPSPTSPPSDTPTLRPFDAPTFVPTSQPSSAPTNNPFDRTTSPPLSKTSLLPRRNITEYLSTVEMEHDTADASEFFTMELLATLMLVCVVLCFLIVIVLIGAVFKSKKNEHLNQETKMVEVNDPNENNVLQKSNTVSLCEEGIQGNEGKATKAVANVTVGAMIEDKIVLGIISTKQGGKDDIEEDSSSNDSLLDNETAN
eukprot:200069_1